ncbi:RT0821/Lpp0805 family surface protein [Prosthecomicrobium sp. N25]|uniref:RT0821/Lpp0805 family surface protein n=1 Tax=Prosthecomicrobium sp. N25 TaxID=3129254 RepID=UPI003076EAFB
MAGLVRSLYRVEGQVRQRHPAWPVFWMLVASASLGACSSLGTVETTGSVQTAVPAPEPEPKSADAQGAESDWATVGKTLARAAPVRETRVEWSNRETGNSGTISDVIAAAPRAGTPCRSFATTFASLDGVRLYHGEACRSGPDAWEVVTVRPAEAKGQAGGRT